MKKLPKNIRALLLLLLAAAMLFSLAACAKQAPAPSAEPSEAPSPIPEATPAVPTPDPDTPAGRAAAKGLPEPPEVDITDRQFIVNNSYNSIREYNIDEYYSGVAGQGADTIAVNPAQELLNAAREAGLDAYVAVGYRNFEWLLNHYGQHVAEDGMGAITAEYFLGPGVNEHQTGLAFDFTDDVAHSGIYYEYDPSGIGDSQLYDWLCEHCAEYGFILRYPEGKEDYYGTACNCAAHSRYVGVDAATYIMDNDLCFEEFLLLYDPDAVFVPEKTDN